MKILAICEDGENDVYSHGKVAREGLSFLSGEGELTYAATIPEDGLSGYDAVIIAGDKIAPNVNVGAANEIGSDIEARFAEYLNGGGGLVFLHAGVVICARSPFLKSVAGCVFLNHPEQCVVEYEITSPHAIAEGANGFAETDEQYFIDFFAADAQIFLEGRSKHGGQIAGYARTHEGRGRVCVLTPGHNLAVFQNEQYQKIIRNAVLWVKA